MIRQSAFGPGWYGVSTASQPPPSPYRVAAHRHRVRVVRCYDNQCIILARAAACHLDSFGELDRLVERSYRLCVMMPMINPAAWCVCVYVWEWFGGPCKGPSRDERSTSHGIDRISTIVVAHGKICC